MRRIHLILRRPETQFWASDFPGKTRRYAVGIVGRVGFLGNAQSARWAIPLLRPNSAQIFAHEAPEIGDRLPGAALNISASCGPSA
jgi:hypothetical protein